MTTKFDDRYYEEKISQMDWDDLLNLWLSIEKGNTPGWQPGRALEYLILRAFQLEGATVGWPYRVDLDDEEIEQIDGAIHSDGLDCLIECKDSAKPINIGPLAKLRNQLLRRPSATVGIFFSRNGFTSPAILVARFMAPQTILLWDGDEIAYALENRVMRSGLVAKYRYCVTHGFPTYKIQQKDLLWHKHT